MIAKFYKGPLHNKKRMVPNGQTRVSIMKPVQMNLLDYTVPVDPLAPMPPQGHYYITRHTHPDGSVFFEWAGWDK